MKRNYSAVQTKIEPSILYKDNDGVSVSQLKEEESSFKAPEDVREQREAEKRRRTIQQSVNKKENNLGVTG